MPQIGTSPRGFADKCRRPSPGEPARYGRDTPRTPMARQGYERQGQERPARRSH
jgi:hypothetical protein